ncbi:deoxyribose-phosphate aldolase [Nevskia sp.]|uniref:deoxyribose-phosphate aldolase n=1 Tax=Nevskia sp. TaxID=1929292 RepID=UPI0025ED9452|nr:deoxyribose-phosphate aldolase [Nevskia sp.]
MDAARLAGMIDHTLLKAEATALQIRQLCAEAVEHGFYSVCVNPRWIPFAVQCLDHAPVLPITVVGFPLGASLAGAKAREAREAVAAGAQEIDMVLDVGGARSGLWDEVANDIRDVVAASGGKPVKVILETCYLSDDEIRLACAAAAAGGARFVKTSTGFGSGGATAAHIRLMRNCVGADLGVKASGGIRDTATALALVEAGATRLGCSASIAIIRGLAASTTAATADGGTHGLY